MISQVQSEVKWSLVTVEFLQSGHSGNKNALLLRCPDLRNANGVFEKAKCVLFIEVSSFHGVLIRSFMYSGL